MKALATKISLLAIAIAVGLVVTTSTSFACRGNGMGHGAHLSPDLSVEQQQKLDAVKGKYSSQLDELETSLNGKVDEYSKALADDSTTVGTLKRLEAERDDLERQYWTLLDQANKEAGVYIAGNNGPWFGCNYRACNNHDHPESHGHGRHMSQNHHNGMHGNHMDRCW